MIPNWELKKVLKADRETVIPVWEHMKKIFDSERDTFEEDTDSCNLHIVIKQLIQCGKRTL